MKIESVSPARYGEPEGGDFEIIIVDVTTDTGLTGRGYQFIFGAPGDMAAKIIADHLAPRIVGLDPWLSAYAWQLMFDSMPRRGADGIARGAIAAIDMALWDIKGQTAKVPVSHLLGGRRERIPTYANCAFHLPPDELAAKAAEYVAAGHKALKIRGSRTVVTPRVATQRVQAVREAIGPDIKLMVDVNGTWDVDTAIGQLKAWEAYDVYWLEEPVPPSDIAGYARVRARAGRTNIVGGEQHAGLGEFQALIDQGGVDIVQPNAAITGGITDWLHIHAYATARAVPVSPWNLQTVHIHMAAGLPNVLWIEYFLPENPLLLFQAKLFAGPVLEEEITEEGVFLRAPVDPGIGITLEPEVAGRALIDG